MTQLTALSAIPFFHDPDLSLEPDNQGFGPPQKGKLVQANPNFNVASVVTIQQNLADIGLYAVQGVYIDNSLSPAPTALFFKGTNQTIIAAPFSQGYYRTLALNQALDCTITNYAASNIAYANNVVPISFLNIMPDAANFWPSQNLTAFQGTPFILSANGANTPLSVTMPNVAGRRSFISDLLLTAGGSTAGLAVNATLTNLDNGGVAQTKNIAFVFPIGALVGAQPVLLNFNPPLPVLPGQAAVLTLPAGGAGNTQTSIELGGFYS